MSAAAATVTVEISFLPWWGKPSLKIEVGAEIHEGLRLKAALEIAVRDRASLVGARLYGANLDGANLDGANLDGANLDGAILLGERPIFVMGPLGRESRYITAYMTNAGIRVRAGCFFGSLDAFRAAVAETHGGSVHGREYAAAIAMIEAHCAAWPGKAADASLPTAA